MISVIVLTYNQQTTIARTLESVLCQRCDCPVEVVIGEDGSSDGTRDVCKDYARRYPDKVRLMPESPNKGVIDNYFDCLLACRGEYIADCAGDDWWIDEQKLQKELDVMRADASVTIVHTAYKAAAADTEGFQLSTFNFQLSTCKGRHEASPSCLNRPKSALIGLSQGLHITEGKSMLEDIITQTGRPVIHLCTALYRKDVLMKAYRSDTFLFRNNEFGCEDLQVCCALAAAGNVAFLSDCTLCYSLGQDTISYSPDDRKQFVFKRRTGDLSFYLCRKYGISSRKTRAFFARRLTALLMHAFRIKDKTLRREAVDCRRRWEAGLTCYSAAVLAATSNAALWSAALGLRKYLLKLKTHSPR